jgi:hypothetical protein
VPNTSAPEQRKRKRLKKSCQVDFCANNETYRGVSDNFSVDGLFIWTDNLLAPQSVVSMTVHLPDGSTSKLKGLVRRVHKVSHDSVKPSGQIFKCGMGIEIIERDPNYMKFFISLLSSITF